MRKGMFRNLVCMLAIVSLSIVGFFGCGGSRRPDANYAAYTETIKAYASREIKPIVDVQLDESGRIKGFKMYPQPKMPNIQQARPHPGWGLAAGALRMAGIFGGIWAVGNSLENIVDSVATHSGGNISIGDNNAWTAGKDVNAAYGGGVSVNGNTTYSSPFNDNSEQCCPDGTGTGTWTHTGTGTGTGTGISESSLFE